MLATRHARTTPERAQHTQPARASGRGGGGGTLRAPTSPLCLPPPPLSSPQVCILAGDFLLAKAAVELSLLESSSVTEIVARGLEAICEGGMRAYNSTVEAEALETLAAERAAMEARELDRHRDLERAAPKVAAAFLGILVVALAYVWRM